VVAAAAPLHQGSTVPSRRRRASFTGQPSSDGALEDAPFPAGRVKSM
jgi:hypothetical protein